MIRSVLVLSMILASLVTYAQQSDNLYNHKLDASKQVEEAVMQAKEEGKHVLIQVGGNWCPWCIKLHHYIDTTPQLDSLVKANYVLIRVNYSKENKNMEMMEQLGFPQRFGFPVLVVLDENGNRIHTQNTGILEKDDFYSERKIADFLKAWSRVAIDPKTYTKKK